MTDEEIMFERLFAPIKAKIQDKNKDITYLKKENARLREYAKFLQDTYCGIDRELAELEKENAELKAQIEKMKCCENCRYYAGADFICNVIRATKYGATKDKNGEDCHNNDKWELAE